MKRIAALLPLLCIVVFSFAQVALAPKKTLEAGRIREKITLDGKLDEPCWQAAAPAGNFVFLWPTPGLPATEKSEIKVVYDDHAVYVAAYLFDRQPDSISHRLSKRDEQENTDLFAVRFDTYQDGQNAVQFGVSPDNVQFDSKFSLANANLDNGEPDGEDSAWDAVWYSAATIVSDGWVVELEIPYSALRFPKKEAQLWSVNFMRHIRRRGETDSWNEVKAEISGSLNQMGILTGIQGIKAPVRLSVTPFVAAYADNRYNQSEAPRSSWEFPFSAGMDLKYGINQAFTLDATIVPDFGQVRTDNYVLNLSPFEVRFDENRPFFTEGTELFNKGGMFYSRRVGDRPLHYWDVYDQIDEDVEEVRSNPNKAQLYNAAKFSGRTAGGLGIGVFNAVEAPMSATVENIQTGAKREIETSPLTNKSVFVLDQNLKNNSSVTFINTNVLRSGADRDANVSGLLFKLKNKAQSYALTGKTAFSTLRTAEDLPEDGFNVNIDLGKTNGNFLWGTYANIESVHYNPRDLGFLYSANEKSGVVWTNYNKYKPFWILNNFWTGLWAYHERLYRPDNWVTSQFGFNFGGNTKKFQNFGVNINAMPAGMHDYFEPRTDDFITYYRIPAMANFRFWYNSDNRKKLTWYVQGAAQVFDSQHRIGTSLQTGINWRATGKLTLRFSLGNEAARNNEGWTWADENAVGYELLPEENVLIGRRRLDVFDNSLNIVYSFTSTMNLNVFARHYWQKVQYSDFFDLHQSGVMERSPYTGQDASGKILNDITANYFNIDMVFTWRFAPGSDLLLVYKNGILNEQYGPVNPGYFRNLGDLGQFPGSNSFSVKVLYYLDYERLRGKN